jgi:predicted transposase YdaD
MGDHDGIFKRAFETAAGARGEIECVLPEAARAALDLDALERVPGSFIDPEMSERLTDRLFRAPLKSGAAGVYIYCLLEHQSTPDPRMPYRVLTYQQRIWAAILRDEPHRKTLPPVITLVIHHGEGGWRAPRTLHQMIEGLDEAPALSRFVPELELLIDDLSAANDEALFARPLPPFPKVVLWLLRDGREIEILLEHLPAWGPELERLAAADSSGEDIGVVLRYILRVAGEAPFEIVRQKIIDVTPTLEQPMASAAEQLIQRGKQEGLETGRLQALRQTLAQLLRSRFGRLDAATEERIANAAPETLERCLARILTAENAEDVFAAD